MQELAAWAARHNVNTTALNELTYILAMPAAPPANPKVRSEAACQAEVRLCAPLSGAVLWRNNVGVLQNEIGVPIRFGLANDSKRLNRRVKSSDLIGILPVTIEAQHVGARVGLFTAIETKHGAWTWTGSKKEQAQARFLNLVQAAGGVAGFVRSKEEFTKLIGRAE